MSSSELKAPEEAQTRPNSRRARHEEGKDDAGVKPEKSPASPLLDAGQSALDFNFSTEMLVHPIPVPIPENAKLASTTPSGSSLHLRVDNLDNITANRGAREIPLQASTPMPAVQSRVIGEHVEEAKALAAAPFHGDWPAISDCDLDTSAAVIRSTSAPSAILAERPGPEPNHLHLNEGLAVSLPNGVKPDIQAMPLNAPEDSLIALSTRLEASKKLHSASARLRNESDEISGRATESHPVLPRAAQNVSVQVIASDSKHFEMAPIRDPAMALRFESRENSPIATAHAGNLRSAEREVFDALDAGGLASSSTWIRTGTRQAEAGFQDPEIGWVTVRASTGANGVHAALVPSSMDAAQSLGSHLSDLSAYLADHHAPVHSVTVSTPEPHGSEQSLGERMDHGAAQGGSHGRQSDSSTDNNPTSGSAPGSVAIIHRSEAIEQPAFAARGGRHISVVA
jgi:hypothetical protein